MVGGVSTRGWNQNRQIWCECKKVKYYIDWGIGLLTTIMCIIKVSDNLSCLSQIW